MKRIRSIKWLFALAPASIAFVYATSSLRLIQLHYPRVVENEPLLAPVKVESVTGDTLVLADGRILRVEVFHKPIDEYMTEPEFHIDLETIGDPSRTIVYVKQRGWLCGTPWVGIIKIPIIPDEVPINHRTSIGFAKIISPGEFEGTERSMQQSDDGR